MRKFRSFYRRFFCLKLKLKQYDKPPDKDGDVQVKLLISDRTIYYTTEGNGLYYAILHEFGHWFNGDCASKSFLFMNAKEVDARQYEELEAWKTASKYCLDDDLSEFIAMANRCLVTYEVKPITAKDIEAWRNDN